MFDFDSHKSEYDQISEFVLKYIQDEIRNTYCLQEVQFPIDEDLKPEF